ncbi:hypothetical protein [Histophilus somni]|uniref:hypothetical protein n=1 Tax=Histophilus somni TaxID=731 RepID=UPI00201F36E8|nr:hypothetical protein [Histophilus somni]
MRNNKNPPTPSIDEVEKYLAQWQRLENYKVQYEALKKLFIQFIPQNILLNDILLKVSTLNDFYSTNIFSRYYVAVAQNPQPLRKPVKIHSKILAKHR